MGIAAAKINRFGTDSQIRAGLRQLETKHKTDPHGTCDSNQEIIKALGSRGGFDGARLDRFSEDWNPGQTHPSTLHRADSPVMRSRARDLVINNPLAKSGVDAYVANVIECGATPKPAFDNEDVRRDWVSAWNAWAGEYEPEADITGQQHLYELQSLWLEEIIVAGGCLTHYVELPRTNGRRLPLAIELIPEERFADERDSFVQWNNGKKSANKIVRGIELDSATGRVVQFWVKPQDLTGYDLQIEPISLPAGDCRYAFFKSRIGQYRGHSLLHAAIMWLWKIGYYTDNELMASAVKSCFAAIITTNDDFNGMAGSPTGTSVDQYGNLLEKLTPALVARIRPGESITGLNPNVPTAECEAWLVFIERCIGIALGLSYEELCRDYSKGNFSSVRASGNADRKRFRKMQAFTRNHFCAPTYKRFVGSCVRTGIVGFPRPAEYVSDMDAWLAVNWRFPGWDTVNPLDDARANDINLANGSTTLEEICAGKGGGDWEDKLEQKAREQSKVDGLKLRVKGSEYDPEAMSIQTANDTKGGNGN